MSRHATPLPDRFWQHVSVGGLLEEDVRAIRTMRAAGVSGPELARVFGIRFSTVYRIASGHLWAHVPVAAISDGLATCPMGLWSRRDGSHAA
jgi:hypothetical protein